MTTQRGDSRRITTILFFSAAPQRWLPPCEGSSYYEIALTNWDFLFAILNKQTLASYFFLLTKIATSTSIYGTFATLRVEIFGMYVYIYT